MADTNFQIYIYIYIYIELQGKLKQIWVWLRKILTDDVNLGFCRKSR
ncbi:MAG: hypothetical protein N7Q72_07130 [Spiroplasma sp. Tabriz.8]|nr:hypothetical protein [Spiroplasma sp. Tabriz.8]